MATKLHSLKQNLSVAGLLPLREQQKKTGKEKVAVSRFSRLLHGKQFDNQQVREAARQEILQDYLEKISEVGWRLQKAPTRNTLKEYRRLIQGFLKQSMEDLYQINEELGRLNLSTGQRKKYSLICLVDEKLEELVQATLREQRMNLEILERIEEINGLLINLLS